MAEFNIKTTGQVERLYRVEADDEEQARKRLRLFISDPDSLRPGLVERTGEQYTTPERIKEVDGQPATEEEGATA